MLYLIGLGLDLNSISLEAREICKRASKVYLENYTVEFPYDFGELETMLDKRIIPLTRIMVENERFADEAKSKDIVLLVYGDPLAATTHVSLILKCKKDKIDYRIIHNASIFDGIAETGLQIYKFGRTASMPAWSEKYKPDSFVDIIKNNMKIKSHTLVLIDIGLHFSQALGQLEESCRHKIKLNKIVVCSRIGTNEGKVYYDSIEDLYSREIYAPFCIIIPSDLHFVEEEALNELRSK